MNRIDCRHVMAVLEKAVVEYRSAPVIHDLVFGQRGAAPDMPPPVDPKVTVLVDRIPRAEATRRRGLEALPENCLTVGASGALP